MKKARQPIMNITPELPLGLIQFEILPRLPAKSVGRFSCVCKQWKSFLSTTRFARMHLNHLNQLVTIDYKLLLLDCQPLGSFRTLDCKSLNHDSTTIHIRCVPFKGDPIVEYILASLDGLVCLASTKSSQLALWNPLTGGYK